MQLLDQSLLKMTRSGRALCANRFLHKTYGVTSISAFHDRDPAIFDGIRRLMESGAQRLTLHLTHELRFSTVSLTNFDMSEHL